MLSGLYYDDHGSLLDDTGHSWRRLQDWVEPDEARELVANGTPMAIQRCLARPKKVRLERFVRDVFPHMMTTTAAEESWDSPTHPNVMVGELWRSRSDGDVLLFIEAGPAPRGENELTNDWA